MSWNVPCDPGADQQMRQGLRAANGAVMMSCVYRHRPNSARAVAVARVAAVDAVARATVAGACGNTGGLEADATITVGAGPVAMAQGEPGVPPDGVPDALRREAVALIVGDGPLLLPAPGTARPGG